MDVNAWGLIDWLVTAVPVIIVVVAVRIGVKQAREFHQRTGDSSLLTSIAAFSRFTSNEDGPDAPPLIVAGQASPPAPAATEAAKPIKMLNPVA